jgi:hypothetical protein
MSQMRQLVAMLPLVRKPLAKGPLRASCPLDLPNEV